MKLLALRLCEHDSNISYFDGTNLHYYKSERTHQVKHHAYSNVWEWRDVIKALWGVNASEIDEIAIIFDPWLHSLPVNNEVFFPACEYEFFPAHCKVWRVNHHYAHYLSCWPQVSGASVGFVFDGYGDYDTSWTVFKEDKIVHRGSLQHTGSLGLELGDAGKWLGVQSGSPYDIAGKVMGLQSYGNIDKDFLNTISDCGIANIKELFSIQKWYDFHGNELLGRLKPLDWIRTIHYHVEDQLVKFFKKYASTDETVIYSGGVAQNVIWNTALRKAFPKIVIPPHCADDGLSLGAIEWLRIKNNLPPFTLNSFPFIQTDIAPDSTPSTNTIKKAAEFLSEGKIVAWYQGHGEIGPRALGNRSLLLDPRLPNGKDKINLVKNRETYRPFGASILREYKNLYFEDDLEDNFMLFVSKVRTNDFPAITHVDGTCRVQTVQQNNTYFYDLLQEFYKLTGCPILLNTSLNVANCPIAGSPNDALFLFEHSDTDILIIGDKILIK